MYHEVLKLLKEHKKLRAHNIYGGENLCKITADYKLLMMYLYAQVSKTFIDDKTSLISYDS